MTTTRAQRRALALRIQRSMGRDTATRLTALQARVETFKHRFDPHQPRDDEGRWTDSGVGKAIGAAKSIGELGDKLTHQPKHEAKAESLTLDKEERLTVIDGLAQYHDHLLEQSYENGDANDKLMGDVSDLIDRFHKSQSTPALDKDQHDLVREALDHTTEEYAEDPDENKVKIDKLEKVVGKLHAVKMKNTPKPTLQKDKGLPKHFKRYEYLLDKIDSGNPLT